MSRGLGAKQRQTLIAVAAWDWPGRSWINWTALDVIGDPDQGPARGKAERASWRRAIRSLEARGFIECRIANREDCDEDNADHSRTLQVRLTAIGMSTIASDPRLFQKLPPTTRVLYLLSLEGGRADPERAKSRAQSVYLEPHGVPRQPRLVWVQRKGIHRLINTTEPALILGMQRITSKQLAMVPRSIVFTTCGFAAVSPKTGL